MKQPVFTYLRAIFLLAITGSCAYAQPTVEQFKQTFEKQMQNLRPQGFTKRSISFTDVVRGTPSGGYYPFKVTAYVHDYAPGYPANKYYGQTCLGKMDGWKFDMRKDDFGEWIVQGRFTVTGSTCADNPAEGAEAIPLSGVPGTIYQPGKSIAANTATSPVQPKPTTTATGSNPSKLYVGEYACYGTGGRLMAGMGFILRSGGRYVDLDNKRGGAFTYNAGEGSITFKGGFLSGQVGKNVKAGFQLSNTVSCEPWR